MDSRSSSSTAHAVLLVICAIVFWASNVVIARAFRAELTPFWLAFWRWSCATLVLFPFVLKPLWRERAQLWAVRGRLFWLALFGIMGNNAFIYLGVASASATSAAALQTFTPVWIMLLGALVLGRRLPLLAWAGVVCAVAGALTIATEGNLASIVALQMGAGEAWLIAASLCWAIYTLIVMTLPRELNAGALLAIQMALGSLLLLPLALVFEPATLAPALWSSETMVAVLYLGVFPSVLAYVFYNRAVKVLGGERTGNFMNLLPAASSLLSFVFLGEMLQGFHLLGFAGIMGGIVLSAGTKPSLPRWLRELVRGNILPMSR
ncbi:DMT family transporter [Craterilacuibacter sp. RT1T]|uniref:DMT family transporter n=1 Tax=Craterilacuibacter sp. RT1T TaxID=2942211 RepID=UPI0020BEE3A9|nr:DMT family transporter [Craterilacuibacter sp. RT1T]MCL6262897.1 DMT family transporter [Craterilacuibacter sp. RT1T]